MNASYSRFAWLAAALIAAAIALFVLGLGAGARPNAPAGPADPGTLRLAMHSDVKSLDPAIAYELNSWPMVQLVNQGLLDYGDGTDLIPWLARELPTVSADGRCFTFRVKPGIRFSNGRELVADDFIYSIERNLDPVTKSPGDGFFRAIIGATEFQTARTKDSEASAGSGSPRGRHTEPTRVAGMRAPDPYTLEIRLKEPDLSFVNIMALPFTYAVPREEVQRRGADFYRHPVGTGPYVLKEWSRGMRMRYERNRYYTQPDRPRIDRVEVLIGADELIQQMMFERGELDLITEIPTPDFIRVTTDPRLGKLVVSMPSNAIRYVALNCEMEPFTNKLVRQAMNYAIDKDRVLKMVNHRGVVARGVLPPKMPGFNPHLKGYPYDPAKAKALLARAGYPGGLSAPVSLWVGNDQGQNVKIAEAIQQQLSEVGIKVELKAVAGAVANEATGRRKNAQCCLSGWYQDYPDPNDFLDVLLRGDRIVDVHCNNVAFYANPQVDVLLKTAYKETDRAHRLDLYRQAEEIIVDDAPWVFLYHPTIYMLHQPWLKGFRMHPVWQARYERVWIDPS